MEKTKIREKVEIELEKWTTLQQKRQTQISFTPKSVDFLCTMIENIQDDKSQYWDYDRLENDNVTQEYAISLIPNALNELIAYNRFERPYKGRDIKISSWEIWHSLSRILDRFCFIPKDI